MGTPGLALAIALTVHLMGPRNADACDRPRSPLSSIELAAVVADAIVTVEVKTVGGGVATVIVTAVHAGTLKENATLGIADILTTEEAMAGGFCGHASMTPGDKRLVLLWNPLGKRSHARLIDDVYGMSRDLDPSPYIKARATPLPHAPWKSLPSGMHTMIAKDPTSKTMDVLVLVRNGTTKAVDVNRTYFPAAKHTYCTLRITNVATKQPIVAADAVPSAGGYGYFKQHGNPYTFKLAPDQATIITLSRITTAKTGWGYKEELGFKHYPVATPGAHTVAADCVNYLGAKRSFTTAAMTLAL